MLQCVRRRIFRVAEIATSLINRVTGALYPRCRGVVVMFHHVSNEPLHDISPSCKCTIEEFSDILAFIKDDVVSLDDMLLSVRANDYNGRYYVVTFDDVAEDFYHNAFPRLSAANIPFTIYVTFNYIGKEGYLTLSQLLEIAKSPLATIGVHTMTHPKLRDKGVDLYEEVIRSRNKLSSLIRSQVRHFAYPYGTIHAINSRVVNFTSKAGFDSATTTMEGYINPYTARNVHRLPRVHNRLFVSKYMTEGKR